MIRSCDLLRRTAERALGGSLAETDEEELLRVVSRVSDEEGRHLIAEQWARMPRPEDIGLGLIHEVLASLPTA